MKKRTILSIAGFPLWTIGKGKGMKSQYVGHKAYVDAGWEVHFVYPSGKTSSQPIMEEGIHVYSVRGPKAIKTKIPVIRQLLKKLCFCAYVLRGYHLAYKIARKVKPSVIYGHTFYGGIIAFLVSRRMKLPVVFRDYGTFLANSITNPFVRISAFEEILAMRLPYDYLILTDDGTQYGKLADYLKIPSDKVRFWINGVDKDIYLPNFDQGGFKKRHQIKPDQRIIVAISRLVRWKRLDRLIAAIPQIVVEDKNVVFIIVGDGPERLSLEAQAKENGAYQYLRFEGALDREQIVEYLNASDIFISLFDYSNVGNSLLESMVCGKCIIALNRGDTAKVIKNGETGMLLEADEIERLPRLVLNLLKDNDAREYLGSNAKNWAGSNLLSWDERMLKEVSLIEDLVARANH